ncbi:MAG: helix-turn-helix domain-containing protein [Caldilinea sp. CFX5]|nr:helix-turn-helix domain-containing protein [Caldilinea sp. CFX5]
MHTRHLHTIPAATSSESDALLAQASSSRLAPLVGKATKYQLQILVNGEPSEVLTVPAAALHLLVQILTEMAQGNAVTVMPMQAELTTQQAVDILNVSRPFLMQLLENGVIPFHKVGTRRRLRLHDVMAYKQRRYAVRSATLDELAAYDQELGLE